MFNFKKKAKAPEEEKEFKIPESISNIKGHLYEYAINTWLGGKGIVANGANPQTVAANANKKDVGTESRELKDGTLFLSTQDLLDIYMNDDIGVDDTSSQNTYTNTELITLKSRQLMSTELTFQ